MNRVSQQRLRPDPVALTTRSCQYPASYLSHVDRPRLKFRSYLLSFQAHVTFGSIIQHTCAERRENVTTIMSSTGTNTANASQWRRGSRGRAPGQEVRGAKPPEAESILVIGCPTEPANLAPFQKCPFELPLQAVQKFYVEIQGGQVTAVAPSWGRPCAHCIHKILEPV